MKKLYIFLYALFCMLTSHLCAQNFVIEGNVTDPSGEGIPGITVTVKGSDNGTATDIHGKYRIINVSRGPKILVFTGIGFETVEKSVNVTNSKTSLSVKLKESTTELNAVQIVGKSEAALVREQSFAVSAIDVKPLQNLNLDVNQVLAKSTGVRIRETGGLGSRFEFSLNGFSGNQVRFFLDGVPMENFGSSLTLNNLPVNIADRIEIYKGVVPVWLGSDALGGAVNIVTNQNNKNYLDASYSFGSFNTHRTSVSGAYTDQKSGFTVRANLFQNYSDNSYKVLVDKTEKRGDGYIFLNEQVEQNRFHDGYDSKSGIVDVGFINKPFADQLLLGMILSTSEKEQQTGATMEKVYGQRLRRSSTVMPTLRYRKSDLLVEGLELNGFASYNFGYTQTIDTASRFYYWDGSYKENEENPDAGELNRTMYRFEDNSLIARANLSYILDKNHSFVVNYTQNRVNRVGRDEANPLEISNKEPKLIAKSVYGFGYKFDWHEQLTVTMFAKNYGLDGSTHYTINHYTTRERVERSLKQSQLGYGSALSYRFPSIKLQLKGSVEQAYRMPEATELFGDGANITGNAQLKPEESFNVNLGVLYELNLGYDHTFNVEANYLERKVSNFIRASVGESDPTSSFINEDVVDVNGVEGSLQYSFRHFLRLSTNATYQVQRNAAGPHKGEQIPNQPYLFANVNALFNYGSVITDIDKLGFGYGVSFFEEYYLFWTKDGEKSEKKGIPRQFTHNVDVNYSLQNGKYNISLSCNNLFDAVLYDNFKLQKPGRAFYLKLRYFLYK